MRLFLLTAVAMVCCGASGSFAVAPQYDTTHVYVAPGDLDRFVNAFVATFGGAATPSSEVTVTPVPSKAIWRVVTTPSGTISAFGYTTGTPYPFGSENGGFLVSDLDGALQAARADGASIVVASFNDPIGRDAIVQWPGGVMMQLYWHPSAPQYPPFTYVPETRVYVSPDRADAFVAGYLKFSGGSVDDDDKAAPGIEIGSPNGAYRRIRIRSAFGSMQVFVTDGHLSFPYGRENTGYGVADLPATLAKAVAAGVTVLVPAFTSQGRQSAVVQFPGGYIAEIHADARHRP